MWWCGIHIHKYIYIYIIYIYIYIYICGIHHRRILWCSYRKFAWVGFELTTNEFRSDALTDWDMRPWLQLSLRAKLVHQLWFHLLNSVRLHFGYCLLLLLRQLPPLLSWRFCWTIANIANIYISIYIIYIYIYIYIYKPQTIQSANQNIMSIPENFKGWDLCRVSQNSCDKKFFL